MKFASCISAGASLPAAIAIALTVIATSPAAFAQSGADARNLDTILVTGSRNSTRTIENSPAPIDLISMAELTATGEVNLLQALLTRLPSLSLQTYGSGLDNQVRGAMLRNLSPGYTLVLVNGKRRNVSAYTSDTSFPGHNYTDLALIPMEAVSHIEVLRDGASAIYGSDAIAGVINIILKSDASGGLATAEAGSSFDGDGHRSKYGVNFGQPLGESGFVNLTFNYSRQQEAARNRPYRDAYMVYPAIDGDGNLSGLGPGNRLLPGTSAHPSQANHTVRDYAYSVPAYTLKSVAWNLEYGLGDSLSLYSFGIFNERRMSSRQNTRPPYTAWVNNPDLYENVYPHGFTPRAVGKEGNQNAVLGLKGAFSVWDWDLSAAHNRDNYQVWTQSSANYSFDYPPGPATGPTHVYSGKLVYVQNVANLDIRRSFDTGVFAAPLDFSVGLEYQDEEFTRGAGELASWSGTGITAYTGYPPADAVNGTRNSLAAYLGASTNITERWYLDVAARFEDHDGFGNVSTGRLTSRFDFTDSFAIRGTVSNGFHAPSLAAQNFQLTSDTPNALEINARVSSPVASALGAVPLKPEKSTNYSLGFTWSPTSHVNLAIDAYQIDISDQLGMSTYVGYDPTDPAQVVDFYGNVLTPAQIGIIDGLLAGAGYSISPDKGLFVSYLRTLGDTRTRGIELTADGSIPSSIGLWSWDYAINAVNTKVTNAEDISPILSALPNVALLNESTIYNLRYRSPRYTQVAGLNWTRNALRLGIRLAHYGPIKRLANNVRYSISPKLTTAISGGYDFGNGISLSAGVDNVFNKKASKIPFDAMSNNNRLTYDWMYDPLDSISAVGGVYYARIDYKF